ncbi:MAG: Methyltransferase type 11 [Myxococcaceae bacterium]|nr:Methyltransferase type 11 [Myxococcaceae bacterium]
MGLGRRKVELNDAQAWVFNRMADVYDARPPYPADLIAAVAAWAELVGGPGARVVDLGAGIGHLSLPLAARGLAVTAVEPAAAMLERLTAQAAARGLSVCALHAKAEAVPLEACSAELVLIADALHFLDAELTAREVARLLVPRGGLSLVTCEFADTPFMQALSQLMQQAAPRRMRATRSPLVQLAAVARVALERPRVFYDAVAVEHDELERILRSISFIGPAMSPARFAAFRERVCALPEPVWARKFTLHAGRRE